MKISGKVNGSEEWVIITGDMVFTELNEFLKEYCVNPGGIFILVDENTKQYCLPILLSDSSCLEYAVILETKSGERNKNQETLLFLWNRMIEKRADRHSLLINLGGGVLSDLGGFLASTFKRGISFINVPTTLMAQADAAIGGKTGINLGNIKNQIGTFHSPIAVFIYPGFLKTLPYQEVKSGFAEIIKTGLIADKALWERTMAINLTGNFIDLQGDNFLEDLINQSVRIKNDIVQKDFYEENERKKLNFGHTFGHALESLSMKKPGNELSHGNAVALGIIPASYLSFRYSGLPREEMQSIISMILGNYNYFPIGNGNEEEMVELMIQDKKNISGEIYFVLLEKIGKAIINQQLSRSQIMEAISFYQQLKF
ncbi:MAG: 3-dehydroquinate synthase [Bacteroidetes bacterium]|nr:3-dehydroquinate synthase [Bacteroidota bacterium]